MKNLQPYQCPKCASKQTLSFETAYKSGFGQTAPPVVDCLSAKDYLIAGANVIAAWAFGGFLIGFFGMILFGRLGFLGVILSWLLAIILPVIYIMKRKRSVKNNKEVWRETLQLWQNTWQCRTCTNTWLAATQ